MEFLQPPGWARPRGYSNGVVANGRMVFVSGMIGWDGQGVFHSDDFAAQVRQALFHQLLHHVGQGRRGQFQKCTGHGHVGPLLLHALGHGIDGQTPQGVA